MDGLIPLVCRALKKTKTRRHYECLSSGASAPDFHVSADYDLPASADRGGHHRRHSSAGDFSKSERFESPRKKQQEMVRFRSQRRMFSCVTLVED
ncbi:hypothetical protein LINPERPRIM_LOCUS43321 [Linum perenne]